MNGLSWDAREDPSLQASALTAEAAHEGWLVVEFGEGGDGSGLDWPKVEAWTRSRAITVAVVAGALASPGLDIALCSDLVYLLPTARLRLAVGNGVPAPGVIWALGRAGRRALARGLLKTGDIEPEEAVDIGLGHAVLRDRKAPPLPVDASLPAATVARDLMRAEVPGRAGLALELAAFRLLFATGHPEEGAGAFLDKRKPLF